jgi:hypothetical protein
MPTVLVINAAFGALVFAAIVGLLLQSITAQRNDRSSLALRLPAHHRRAQNAGFVHTGPLGA